MAGGEDGKDDGLVEEDMELDVCAGGEVDGADFVATAVGSGLSERGVDVACGGSCLRSTRGRATCVLGAGNLAQLLVFPMGLYRIFVLEAVVLDALAYVVCAF